MADGRSIDDKWGNLLTETGDECSLADAAVIRRKRFWREEMCEMIGKPSETLTYYRDHIKTAAGCCWVADPLAIVRNTTVYP